MLPLIKKKKIKKYTYIKPKKKKRKKEWLHVGQPTLEVAGGGQKAAPKSAGSRFRPPLDLVGRGLRATPAHRECSCQPQYLWVAAQLAATFFFFFFFFLLLIKS
jgi:hypothetical protein